MQFLRGLICSGLVLSVAPELVTLANAEPIMVATTETASAIPEAPSVKIVPVPTIAAAPAIPPATGDQAAPAAAAPVAPPKPAITLQAKVDLGRQTLTVSERGKVVGTWKISSGVSAEFATPRGLFKPEWSAKMWYSKKYDDAPMPHAVFFKSGAAIHATQAVGRLGTPASHGCVRLAPANAETFYKLVQRHGLAHTQIHVFGDAPYPQQVARASTGTPRAATVASRPNIYVNSYANSGYAGWSGAPRPVQQYQRVQRAQYANASPFAGPVYTTRLPISAARVR